MAELRLLCHDLGSGATAFTTTRAGGCSRGAYAEFNINPYCGDDPAAVEANLRLLAARLGIEPGAIVMPHQTHGTEVRLVARELLALPQATRSMVLEGVDALMTAEPGICIGVSTADCLPVLLYDPGHRACCAVHAGWRGTAARIVQKAVAAMAAAFGTRPAALAAVIGPGISVGAFEVGDEVYDAFASAGHPMERIARREAKWHIDLAECNRLQLLEAGVEAASVRSSGLCTYSHADELFSARRLGAASGRMFSGIMINQS